MTQLPGVVQATPFFMYKSGGRMNKTASNRLPEERRVAKKAKRAREIGEFAGMVRAAGRDSSASGMLREARREGNKQEAKVRNRAASKRHDKSIAKKGRAKVMNKGKK